MSGPTLWYLNRATGVVLMVLLTLAVVLGLLVTAHGAIRRSDRGVPRFVGQSLHRNLSLLSVALLAAHVVTAVVDTYVDIRWWQAIVPWGASYKPLWLALGTLSLDVMVAVVVTSLLRARLGHRSWRLTHLLAYLAWGLSVLHGRGIGSDARSGWMQTLTLGCLLAVALAALPRMVALVAWRQPGSAR